MAAVVVGALLAANAGALAPRPVVWRRPPRAGLVRVRTLPGTRATVAEIATLGERGFDASYPSPIGAAPTSDMTFTPHDDFFVDDGALIESQVAVNVAAPDAKPATRFRRAGPRRSVAFGPGEARAAVVTCGGVCPGLNTVVREVALCLRAQYGVETVLGVMDGYAGFAALGAGGAVDLDRDFVDDIHTRGGTVLRSSRGGHDTATICDALEAAGITLVFLVGGDGTMKGGAKIDAEMARRGRRCAVAVVPKTIDNDIPVIDKSFGFSTAVEAAVPHVRAAHTEAEACPNGVGVVKVMGRHSGFIAMHATLAAGCVDLCLVPESAFDLRAVLDHVERVLRRNGHALVVVAEGAGQAQMGAERVVDASGNAINAEVGAWLKARITDHFASAAFRDDPALGPHPAKCFLVDPTYTIRAVPANAGDQVYCSSLAHAAVHGAMAGYTRFLVGDVNTRLAMLPLDLVVNRRNIVAIRERMWTRLLFSTAQPPFEAAASDAAYEEACDAEALYASETAAGGCTVVFADDY